MLGCLCALPLTQVKQKLATVQAAEGMTSEMLHCQLQMVYSQYTAKVSQRMAAMACCLT